MITQLSDASQFTRRAVCIAPYRLGLCHRLFLILLFCFHGFQLGADEMPDVQNTNGKRGR